MDYHLERKIRLNDKTEHQSLYAWCLEEIDAEGKRIGRELIPWNWGFPFTASELRLNQGIEFGELSVFDEDLKNNKDKSFDDIEIITATLHPGICTDGEWLEHDTRFSMFGTNRNISDFSLRIYKIQSKEKERCNIWGGVSYTAEVDFRDETSPDVIEIQIGLSEYRFNKLSELISMRAVDVARVNISGVSGFYSDWSPSISTDSVKVLTRGSEQKVIIPDECNIDPPRLGDVGMFNITLITRSILNPKQNFDPIDISSIFNIEDDLFDEEPRDVSNFDTVDLMNEFFMKIQAEIAKLKTPLWVIAFLIIMLIFLSVSS